MESGKRAIALVEILAVLFIAGLVAAVAIPEQPSIPPDLKFRALCDRLDYVRLALDRYQADHGGRYPADVGSAPRTAMADHATGGRHSGPYARPAFRAYLDRVPENPFSGGRRVGPASTPAGASDWVYDPITGSFKANDCRAHRAL